MQPRGEGIYNEGSYILNSNCDLNTGTLVKRRCDSEMVQDDSREERESRVRGDGRD